MLSICFDLQAQLTPPIEAVSNPDIMFNCFRQGKVAGGGNCAAIALIKASILTFGINGVFSYSYGNGVYAVRLKTGENLTVQDNELQDARDSSGFVQRGFNGYSSNDTIEKNKILEYAYLCFAVMGKMVMKHGDGNKSKSKGQFIDSCYYNNYKNAIYDLNEGGFTPTNYHLLGLDEHVFEYKKWHSSAIVESGITWSTRHAMFMRKGFCDSYGKKTRLLLKPKSNGRIYLSSSKLTDFGKRRPFKECNDQH